MVTIHCNDTQTRSAMTNETSQEQLPSVLDVLVNLLCSFKERILHVVTTAHTTDQLNITMEMNSHQIHSLTSAYPTTASRLMGPVRICHNSHEFATKPSQSVDRAGRQAKMASIEFWIPWRNVHMPHSTNTSHQSPATAQFRAYRMLAVQPSLVLLTQLTRTALITDTF